MNEQLSELSQQIKEKTGRYQMKLLTENGYPLGSSMLLHYRDRYFVVTCNHCINQVENPNDVNQIIAPITSEDGRLRSFNLRNFKRDEELDLAAFEISFVDLTNTQNQKGYITESLMDDIDQNPLDFERDLIAFHAVNWYGYEREESDDQVVLNLETLPYMGAVIGYEDDYVEVAISRQGIGEDGNEYEIETFSGMSGSPAFRVYQETRDVKWIGILTNGEPDAELCYVLDYKIVLTFLNNQYFA